MSDDEVPGKIFTALSVLVGAVVVSVMASIPLSMKYSVDRSMRLGATTLEARKSCLGVVLRILVLTALLVGIPHVYSGLIVYNIVGWGQTREEIVRGKIDGFQGQIKRLKKEISSGEKRLDKIADEDKELVEGANKKLRASDNVSGEKVQEFMADIKFRQDSLIKENNSVLAGIDEMRGKIKATQRSINEHKRYLEAINDGRRVATPYDDPKKNFEEFKLSKQVSIGVPVWLAVILLICFGALSLRKYDVCDHVKFDPDQHGWFWSIVYGLAIIFWYCVNPEHVVFSFVKWLFPKKEIPVKNLESVVVANGDVAKIAEEESADKVLGVGEVAQPKDVVLSKESGDQKKESDEDDFEYF